MRAKLTILLLSIIAWSATSRAQDAEAMLKQFEGKTLILRHPLDSGSQRYDAEGRVLKGGSKEGSWAVLSGVLIDRVTLTPDKLHVDDFLESLPDFWRAYLVDHHFSYDASQKKEAEYRWNEEVDTKNKPGQNVQSEPIKDSKDADFHERVVYPIGTDSGVKAPKPKYTPEPAFSEIARYEEFQGIVVVNVIVGSDGKIQRFRLLRPLGMGLDENAQSTLQTWRFQPATRNGQPVAVEMNIEIAFDLF